ncbi:MAG: phospholipase D-like domain-containing protein [Thermotogota bacterium]|nr:phospholipase D-like domain-containing protein [Thermotogota bacterium]
MKIAGKISLVIVAVIMLNTRIFSYPADSVRPLFNKEYDAEITSLIQEAEELILIVMYCIQPGENKYHPIHKLLRKLIEAHQRGVEVEVILEIDDKGGYLNEQNVKAKEILESAGIKVRFDSGGTVTHVKLIIIDGYTTVTGSHNWTYTAFALNNEASVVIESPEIAAEFYRYFRTVR